MEVNVLQSCLALHKRVITGLHEQQIFFQDARSHYSKAGIPELAEKNHKLVEKVRKQIKAYVEIQKELKKLIKSTYYYNRIVGDLWEVIQ